MVMVKKLCEEVRIEGRTNHSLRATGATRLFEANVPKKLIKEVTGHRSSDSLRVYEHTSISQQQVVSTLMCGQSRQFYLEAVISEPVLEQTKKPVLGESIALFTRAS